MVDGFSLRNKVALVTGSSKGIGRAIAMAYGRAGADVAVLARSTDALEEVASELADMGRRSLVLTCDVTDETQVKEAVSAAIDQLGHVDILVNNAGVMRQLGPFLTLTTDDWTEVLNSNLRSVVTFCREVGKHMVGRGSGSIINVSSVAGTMGMPMVSHYGSTKSAVITLTRTLASEWAGSGVRVNAIAPGYIKTELTSEMVESPESSAALMDAVPMNRWGDPEEVAGAAVFLASEAARLITGVSLVIDGGLTTSLGGRKLLGLVNERFVI